jgi:NHL repeat
MSRAGASIAGELKMGTVRPSPMALLRLPRSVTAIAASPLASTSQPAEQRAQAHRRRARLAPDPRRRPPIRRELRHTVKRRSSPVLIALCALGLSLALAPAAHATTYSVVGSFDEVAGSNLGLAVDQADGHVYVGNYGYGLYQFDASGSSVAPEPFATRPPFSAFAGVAVDPTNDNVYAYEGEDEEDPADAEDAEIATFEPSGTELGHFMVTGGQNKFVQIASDSAGDIFYPNQKDNTVQEFSPSGALLNTFSGGSVGAFSAPQGVAVDSSGDVFVVDAGNGRVVEIAGNSGQANHNGAQSVLDSGGSRDVAVDPVSGDVFALDLSEEGSCAPLSATEPCYRVRAYHSGATTPFAEFGAGTIGNEGLPNHIAVDHDTGQVYVSAFEQKVWIFAPGTLPQVTYPTPSATGVTASEATLHGEVNPEEHKETSCHFEYGTSEAYGASVPCQPELVGEGSTSLPEALAISGLEANTEYHFRLVTKTAAGAVVNGADQTFTTEQAPPSLFASSVLASGVTQNDVVFNAKINPQHPVGTHVFDAELETRSRYYFNYGLAPFEDPVTCEPLVPYASAPAIADEISGHSISEEVAGVPVSLELDGASVVLHPGMESRALQPNTAYRFQAVVENVTENLNTRTVEQREVSCQPEATFITLPPDPLATSGVSSGVTQTAATLAGAVTPGSTGPNSDTTWHFQYGIDTSYTGGNVPATPGDAGVGTSAVPVSSALVGLAPNTTYHYRLVASNANEDPVADPAAAPQVADGADRTFTTLPSEPVLGQPSGLSETGVTLNGSVDAGGHALEYVFQYGTTTAYGQRTSTEKEEAEGATLTPVIPAPITGLAPGTYHYRLVAVGAGGESYSPDSTFTLYAPALGQTGNPFGIGQSAAAPFTTTPLLSTATFPPPPTETVTRPKPLTKAQRLAKALKVCKEDKAKGKRAKCQKEAQEKYGRKATGKKTATRGGRS